MGVHYLVDLYGNPVSTAKVIDVRTPSNGQSLLNGTFLVRVPDGVQVQKPTDLTDLLTKKYAGLLSFYAGFTRIAFDDLLDATSIDTVAATTAGALLGERSSIALLPAGAFQTVTIPLTPGTPTVAVVTWETFQVTDSDSKTDRFQRTYAEVSSTPMNVTCSVSFNGGATFNSTLDGAILNIPLSGQGTSFVLRLTNASANRLGIGSWAVIY
jgi:hypothetical protein